MVMIGGGSGGSSSCGSDSSCCMCETGSIVRNASGIGSNTTAMKITITLSIRNTSLSIRIDCLSSGSIAGKRASKCLK